MNTTAKLAWIFVAYITIVIIVGVVVLIINA
jgi:hypothetical protein